MSMSSGRHEGPTMPKLTSRKLNSSRSSRPPQINVMALAVAIAAMSALTLSLAARFNQPTELPALSPPQGFVSMADSLLTDSILSIVQNYYVDPDRVSNSALMDSAIRSLNALPSVSASRESEVLVLESGGKINRFSLSPSPTYQEVITTLATMMAWLQGVGPNPNRYAGLLGPGSLANLENSTSIASPTKLIDSLLKQLDPHSALLSPEAYEELRQGTEGSFGGLGILVGIRDQLLTVIKPLPHSPAMRHGIEKGDRILKINEVDTFGYSIDELIEHMRGEPGSKVVLSLLRQGAYAPQSLELQREIIQVDSVTSVTVDRDGASFLHLTVDTFSSHTAEDVLTSIRRHQLRYGETLGGIILDLRQNPGGLLDQAVELADIFLESGVIVSTKGRSAEVQYASADLDELTMPVAVLIDRDSASASEIVAGALQDHQRAIVIGQPSFGKGSVQTVFEVPGHQALKLTIAKYFTPSGRSIQNVGIRPDIWLQPIKRSSENVNLLGDYRYRNEGFLTNHLRSSADKGLRQDNSFLKSYYLLDEANAALTSKPTSSLALATAASKQDGLGKNDIELHAAVEILSKVHATYPNGLTAGAQRSTHWLGLAAPELIDTTSKWHAEAADWLQSSFGVDWSRPAQLVARSDVEQPLDTRTADAEATKPLDLRLKVNLDDQMVTEPGATLQIPYRLSNRGFKDHHHLSLFVGSPNPAFETTEILLGTVGAGRVAKGIMKIEVPTWWSSNVLNLRIGVAQTARSLDHLTTNRKVIVNSRSVAELGLSVGVVDHMSGNSLDSVASDQQANLKITIKNHGVRSARQINLRYHNLAGQQLQLDRRLSDFPDLEPGEVASVVIPIKTGQTILTDHLALGVQVESRDLQETVQQQFKLPATTNGSIRNRPKLLNRAIGH